MGFILIKGTFHVKGYSPDGDSIKFKAKNSRNWLKIGGRVKLNRKSHAQLRFEAIDTLETHYNRRHQPNHYAHGAMNSLLTMLNITNVQWNNAATRITSAEDGTDGYILTREAERYGRPVAFVFAGSTQLKDGSDVFLTPQMMRDSSNYQLIDTGMAYPTYYAGLFHDLREEMSKAAVSARNNGVGLHSVDKTFSGFEVTGVNALQNQHVILPKLFRRLIAHLDDGNTIRTFKSDLEDNPEKVLIVSRGHFTHFDNLIDVTGKTVKMNHPIEDVVFL